MYRIYHFHCVIHYFLGLDQRRSQVSELVREEENFQKNLQEVTEIINHMNALSRHEISDVTLEKCEQLANQYQVWHLV